MSKKVYSKFITRIIQANRAQELKILQIIKLKKNRIKYSNSKDIYLYIFELKFEINNIPI